MDSRPEAAEQEAVIAWARLSEARWPELRHLIAIPNGEHRAKHVAIRLQRQGVRPGVSDLFLPVPRVGADGRLYLGLWLEMKRRDKASALSVEQVQWMMAMDEYGYRTAVAAGSDKALAVLQEYLSMRRINGCSIRVAQQ